MSTASQADRRVPNLDLLRGAAAFAVMGSHYFLYSQLDPNGIFENISVTAVEVFFVLSGFVLGPQIKLCATRRDWPTLRTFLVRRWMRTIPSYLVALLAISIIFGEVDSKDFIRYAAYVQNLFSQHNVLDYYPVAWSLSVEEWYYVAFPIFLLLCGATIKGRNIWTECLIAVVLFIAIVTVGRIVFGDLNDWGRQVRRVVVFRVDAIGYGFLLYLILQRWRIKWEIASRAQLIVAFLITAAVVFAINARMAVDDAAWLRYLHPFASAAFGAAAIVLALSFDAALRKDWTQMVFTYLGRISYPVYLFHLIVLYGIVAFGIANGWTGLFLYSSAVIVCATLFFFGFEQPILANRPRYRTRSEPDVSAIQATK